MPVETPRSIEDLYPEGPDLVPEDLTEPSPAYKRNAWLAVLALVAFGVLYLGLTFWFGRTAWRLVVDGFEAGGGDAALAMVLALVPTFFFVFLVRGLLFIQRGSDPTRVEITEADEPLLFAFVHRVADEVGAPRPHRIFLSPTVNAAVFYDLASWNLVLPTRKNLLIGLGLVNVVTLDELKAVLAHEFGHFAQRSMAVGTWVYTSQQVVQHVVGVRGRLDELLAGLSRFDLRFAWIGWIMSLLVWAIRAVLDTALRGVVLAERALSRQMEFQADRVAVSVTGSDSLIHGLWRLGPADDAWDRATALATTELEAGRPPEDLFAIQTRILEKLREIHDEPTLGLPPEVPERGASRHRVFESQLAAPPKMWSSHPPNQEREESAKQRYLPSKLDGRSAWSIFSDPEALRHRLSQGLFASAGFTETETCTPLDETLAGVDERFGRTYHQRRYRGAWLGRSGVLGVDRVEELYEPLGSVDRQRVLVALQRLYPQTLADDLQRWRERLQECHLLEGLKSGALSAPGGVIRHRGQELRRKDLSSAILRVKSECDAARDAVQAHDRACRSAHRRAARNLGQGWEEHLVGLARLLHYAEHTRRDLEDAKGYLLNVWQIVAVDQKITEDEQRRLRKVSGEVYTALSQAYADRSRVVISEVVADKLEVTSFRSMASEDLGLPFPTQPQIMRWLQTVDSWIDALTGPLSALSNATREALLEAEAQVETCLREERDPGPAPAPAEVPDTYTTRCPGSERPRQTRLDLWDRFQVADGWIPGTARLGVALGLLVPATMLSVPTTNAKVTIYNGLGIAVLVAVGDQTVHVPSRGTRVVDVVPSEEVAVTTATLAGDLVESFEEDVSSRGLSHVYSVAGAAPLVEWTASYGRAPEEPDRQLGAPRWLTSRADHLFTPPPEELQTRGGTAFRDVLDSHSELTPWGQVLLLGTPEEQEALMRVHARWDALESHDSLLWLSQARQLPDFPAILAERLAADPDEPALLRLEQDSAADPLVRAEVCGRHRGQSVLDPANPDLIYVATRCLPEEDKPEAFLQAAADYPDHPWLTMAAGFMLAGRGQVEAARDMQQHLPKTHPALATLLAVDLARVMRLAGEEREGPALRELAALNGDLAYMLWLDPPYPDPEYGLTSTGRLMKGHLETALEVVDADGQPFLLQTVAASDGASEELKAQALARDPATVVSRWNLGAVLGLHGPGLEDTTALRVELVQQFGGDEASVDRLLDLATGPDLRSDPDDMEALTEGLSLFLKGQARVMGLVMLGDEAPETWRAEARAMLLAPERPYLR